MGSRLLCSPRIVAASPGPLAWLPPHRHVAQNTRSLLRLLRVQISAVICSCADPAIKFSYSSPVLTVNMNTKSQRSQLPFEILQVTPLYRTYFLMVSLHKGYQRRWSFPSKFPNTRPSSLDPGASCSLPIQPNSTDPRSRGFVDLDMTIDSPGFSRLLRQTAH